MRVCGSCAIRGVFPEGIPGQLWFAGSRNLFGHDRAEKKQSQLTLALQRSKGLELFVPQGFNRFKVGGAFGRVQPEE